jgi:hypothetical protein
MSRIPIDNTSSNTLLLEYGDKTTDTKTTKPNLLSFLRNTEGPYIAGMTTRTGKPGMPATMVVEPWFWSGQWARRSNEIQGDPDSEKHIHRD